MMLRLFPPTGQLKMLFDPHPLQKLFNGLAQRREPLG